MAAFGVRAGGGKSGLHGNTVPGNARRGRPQGKCHRKQTAWPSARESAGAARVKGCGKSAPRSRRRERQGKPHREQDQIGTAGRAIAWACFRRRLFHRKIRQRACKPGSVHALRRWATIPLGGGLLRRSSNQPGRRAGTWPICRPYSVLLPVGFTMPPPLPEARWALTPPFRPGRTEARWTAFCGTFPGVAPAGHYPAPSFHGARTFLPSLAQAAAARPSGGGGYSEAAALM